ncbi:MAG: MFS transporter [Rhodospirillales bacterium]|nr:MFS transporter [Rhodospirillales bacterium]
MSILFLIVVIDLIGFGIIIPLLPFYAERFQATPDVVTLVMATYSLAQLIALPLWGRLSDRIGRRPVLLVSLVGIALSYVWLGFADSLLALFAARAICGAMAGHISAAFAYVADITDAENRTKGMGVIGAAWGLGFFIGPAIGGILAGPDAITADFQTPSFAAAALSAVAFVLTAVFLKESLSPEIRARNAAQPDEPMADIVKGVLKNPALTLWIVLTFFVTFVLAGMETTFAMWTERSYGWGPRPNGFLLTFVGLVTMAVQGGLIGRLRRRWDEQSLLIQGAAFMALASAAIPFAATPWILVVVMAAMAYGFAVASPALNSLISLEADERRQGSILGLSRSSSTAARVVGPACAGVLFAALGKDAPYYLGAVVMLGVVMVAYRYRRRSARSAPVEDAGPRGF